MNTNTYKNTELLRFTTAGSVDDGKSTLIGRLLYDSKSIYQDQYEAIKVASEKRGEETVNLALLTDGLKSEREQGITIDVAYRYFSTPKRKFIIADTPGHIQYTYEDKVFWSVPCQLSNAKKPKNACGRCSETCCPTLGSPPGTLLHRGSASLMPAVPVASLHCWPKCVPAAPCCCYVPAGAAMYLLAAAPNH